MDVSSEPSVIVARTESRSGPAASFVRRGRGGADRSHRAVPSLCRQLRSLGRHAGQTALLALGVLALGVPAGAQTDVLVSNLGQQASTTPGFFNRFDAAQAFTTGTDTTGYTLTSVDIDFNVARSITGYVYSVGVWSATVTGEPATSLGTLTNPPFTTGTNTIHTFTASDDGIDLNASTAYLVVVNVTTVGTGDFSIVNTTSNHEDTEKATGWSIADTSRLRIWNAHGFWTLSTETRKIRVNGYAKSGTSNTAPTAADNRVTTSQDTAYTFTAANFNFADTDAGDTLASVKIVTLPGAGSLTHDGTAVTVDQVVPKADIDASQLVFTPLSGGSGTPYTTFTFKANDGTVDSAAAYMMTVNVTPANTAPTGAPTITGTAVVGQPLTASTTGIVDADGLGSSFTYQWVRVDADGTSNPVDIPGATTATYTLTADDVGKKITVTVRFTDDLGNLETLTSTVYPANGTVLSVAPPPPPPPPPPPQKAELAQVMGVTVAPGNAQLVVTWTAVDTATGYAVQWTSGDQDYNTGDRQATVTPGSTTSYTIGGLMNGTAYTVRVIATRMGADDGPPSAEVTGTPAVPTSPDLEPFQVAIVGVPEVAVTGESYELTAQSDAEEALVYAWQVAYGEGGSVEPSDTQTVVWTAPAGVDVAWIRVDATREEDDAAAGQSAYVRVEAPAPAPEEDPEPVPALPLLGQLLLALGLTGAGARLLSRRPRVPPAA